MTKIDLTFIAENDISIDFAPKVVWATKRSPLIGQTKSESVKFNC